MLETRLDPAAKPHAGEIADLASLRALLICLIREWPEGIPAGLTIEWAAPAPARPAGPMRTGLGRLGRILWQGRALDAGATLSLLCDHMARHGGQRGGPAGAALARRVRASRARIATLAAGRLAGADPAPDFLTAEQAMLFGHWMHPCPKALFGMTLPEERAMTPDWRGALRLHALSLRADLACGSAADGRVPDAVRALPGLDADPGDGRVLLPAHPLTWDRAQRDPRIAALLAEGAIRDLGPVGPGWWASSSVRTLWRGDCDWQIKVSLPVTITNSQRVNKHHELLAGAAMAARIGALNGRFGPLRLIGDPHWATLRLPGCAESGLEVILRDNPWRGPRGGQVMQIAGLLAEPLPGRTSLLAQVMEGHDPAPWFAAYLDCAVAPLLRLYDATGIAVEAHQQNALLDLSQGLPCRCDIRDNQGFYIAEDMADAGLRAIPQLVYPRPEAEDALGYTLIVNQVFGVIHRMALDDLLPETQGLRMLAVHLAGLTRLAGHGGALARRWLRARSLPAKGNLLTQLGGVDELLIPGERAPVIAVPNPLPAFADAQDMADVA